MPIATPDQYKTMFAEAQNGGYALPAINVSSIETINAALAGFAEAKSDGIIQVSVGGGKFASGRAVGDASLGARVLAIAARELAQKYDVLVGLHTDHCQPDSAEKFLSPLLRESENRVRAGGQPLFNSHMLDASALPLEENLKISDIWRRRCNDIGMLLELEIGVVGGEEEGAPSAKDSISKKLYTSAEDMLEVRRKLGKSAGSYLLAATFGNVHGSYKSGVVKLKPKILEKGQTAVESEFGLDSRFDLVFHGGSGSSPAEIREAISYGVVKMNIDTDTQYAFTKPVAVFLSQNIESVLKIDGEVGDKKFYDPRAYLSLAQDSMSRRVAIAASMLLSANQSV